MKKIIIFVYLFILLFTGLSFADDFEIIPKSKDVNQVKSSVDVIGNEWWMVWDNYNNQASWMNSLSKIWDQISSGIMTWDTLINYVVYLIRFVSQIWLLIWGVMIIYAWYLYATSVFWGDANSGKKHITDAIIWVLIIAFSYAIMKFLTAAFLT